MTYNIQKGTSLYLTIIIVGILLSISLGISAILLGQIRTIIGIGNSVVAFYAADTGTEVVLYEDKLCRQDNCTTTYPYLPCTITCQGLPSGYTTSAILENDSNYKASFSTSTEGTIYVQSVGIYKGTRRAIEAAR